MKDLAKNTAVIGGTEFLLVFVAIIRNKYLAVTIGPEGFGIYSLLSSFFAMIAVFAGTWLGAGTTKYVAEYSDHAHREERNQVFTLAVVSVVLIGISLTLVSVLARKLIISDFLSKDVAETYYLLFAAGFIGMSLNPILMNVLQGALEVKMVVKARIIISSVDVLLIIALVHVLDLLGFFVGILISATFASCVLFYFVYSRSGFRFARVSLRDQVSRDMTYFGGMSLVTGLLNLGSLYLQRFLLVERMGIGSVGIFQAGYSIMNYLGLVNRGSSFHLFPTMSKVMESETRVRQLNEYLVFILLVTIPVSVTAILFGSIAIHVLYSKEFLPLSSCLFWFVAAQFVMMLMTSFQTTVVGMARLKLHTFAVFLIHSLWIIVPFFLIREYGIASLAMGFLAGGIVGAAVYIGYLRRAIRLRFDLKTGLLAAYGIIAIGLAVLSKDSGFVLRIALAIIITTGSFSFLSSDQQKKLLALARKALLIKR